MFQYYFSLSMIDANLSRLKKLRNNIVASDDLQVKKNKFYSIIYDLKIALAETELANYLDDLSCFDIDLDQFKMNVTNTHTLEGLKGAIDNFTESFENIFDANISFSNKYLNVLEKNVTYNSNMLLNILGNINPTRKYNIFEIGCYEGNNLKFIKDNLPNANIFGLANSKYSANIAKKYGKIIIGDILRSRITNEVFDFTICHCTWNSYYKDNIKLNMISKKEKNLMTSALKYTQKDGIVMFVVPYFRLYKDVCMYLAKNLKNVLVVKDFSENFNSDKSYKLVYIIGNKKEKSNLTEEDYNTLRACYDYSKVPTVFDEKTTNALKKLEFPNSLQAVSLFKGSVLDVAEMTNLLKNSAAFRKFKEDQKVEKLSENQKEPLLPFNIGQIGLVLTSGCLDGIIDEGDGHFHVVKGKVSKTSDTSVERDSDGRTSTETTVVSNKVEINVLLPNGDFKTLA